MEAGCASLSSLHKLQSWEVLELERASWSQLGSWGQGVCGQSWEREHCMSRCPHLSPSSLSLSLLGEWEWDGLGRWGARRIPVKVCGGLGGPRVRERQLFLPVVWRWVPMCGSPGPNIPLCMLSLHPLVPTGSLPGSGGGCPPPFLSIPGA